MRKTMLLILVLFFFRTVNTFGETNNLLKRFQRTKINVEGRELIVLVADTVEKREQGLSNIELNTLNRAGVDGMLFIFNDSSEKTFQAWYMKFDLMLITLEKIGDKRFKVKDRKSLRIGTIQKVMGKYILEVPLRNTLTGAR
jgi:uncharacterized membrane protein (UPF0127 family)